MKDTRTKKKSKKFKIRKLTKKEQLMLFLAGGVLAILVIIVLVVSRQNVKADENDGYELYTMKKADSLIFNGTVSADKTESFHYDQGKGTISEILVTDNQEVQAGTELISYNNETAEEQVKELEQSLDKLNLMVTAAQQNLDSANARKRKLEQDRSNAAHAYNNADETTAEGQAVRLEQKAIYDQLDDSVSAQNETITRAQQELDSANLDVAAANKSLEEARGKIDTKVTASIDGLAIVDVAGKTDASIPVVKVISREIIVEGKVSEYDYSRFKLDQKVTIEVVNNNEKTEGAVMELSKLPDDSAGSSSGSQSAMENYTFKVKPSEEIQYGYSCQIILPVDEIRIPEKSVVEEYGEQYVYKYSKGKVKKVKITAEEKNDLFIVQSGLKENDKIISNPDDKLKDGKEVSAN